MTKFVLLYTGGSMPESATEQAKVMQAWQSWFGGLGSSLVDGGNQFTPQAKSISQKGTVNNSAVGTPATGYTIIQADSFDAAMKLAKECPVLQSGAQITVYEAIAMG